MMYSRLLLPLLLWLVGAGHVSGQQKYEKESRIHPREVPADARQFIDSIAPAGKIRWYLEENLDRQSLEAKFRYREDRYSIEFDRRGKLEDIEIQIAWEEIPEKARRHISGHLDSAFTAHRVRKIQVQYTGSASALLSLARDRSTDLAYTTQYELVIKARDKHRWTFYEITFSGEGKRTSISEIIFRNTDHLEF